MILAEVVSDPKNPGGDLRGLAHAVQILLNSYKRFLDEVIGY
jgi:hypothetical protein